MPKLSRISSASRVSRSSRPATRCAISARRESTTSQARFICASMMAEVACSMRSRSVWLCGSSGLPRWMGPSGLMPNSATMRRAISTARSMSFDAPAVIVSSSRISAARPPAREDGDLVYRVAVLDRQADGDVARLVDSRRVALLLVHHEALALDAHQNLVARVLDVRAADRLGAVARRGDGGLVQEVGEVGAGEAGRAAR